MNAPFSPRDLRERLLADKLLAIDIAFDSIKRAQRIYARLNPGWRPLASWEDGPTPDGEAMNDIRRRIHRKALMRAGLPVPLELVPDIARLPSLPGRFPFDGRG